MPAERNFGAPKIEAELIVINLGDHVVVRGAVVDVAQLKFDRSVQQKRAVFAGDEKVLSVTGRHATFEQ